MQKLLYTIPYKSFDLWDVKRYSKITYKSQYSIELLGKHINSEIEKVEIFKFPETTFNILGISNEIGMYDAYDKNGKEFNQSYKVVKNGYIAYNPYRINVGSIGIKTSKLKGDLISPAYVVFSCKNTVMPEFLFLLMKTKWFNAQVKGNTSGSVRQNLTFEALSRIMIPVPPLSVQAEIINNYHYRKEKAKTIISTSWKKLDEYFVSSLQAKNYKYNPFSKYTFGVIDFKILYRWDSWARDNGLTSEKYDIVPFGHLILEKPQYGANVKGVDKKCDYRYIRITDINEDGTLNQNIKYPEKVEEVYILQENDFLIARSGNTVGKTFLYKSGLGKAIYAGYLVRYILNTNMVIPKYLLYYTKTTIFKNWIAKNQRVAGQPNINGQEYLTFPVILPPLDIQMDMVKRAEEIIQSIRQEQEMSYSLLEQAKQDFENAIFG